MKVSHTINDSSMLGKRYNNDGLPTDKNMNNLQLEMKRSLEKKVAEGAYSFESVPCLICNSTGFDVLSRKDRFGIYAPTVICRNCGLIQANPRMSEDSYFQFYNNEYRKLYGGNRKTKEEYFRKILYNKGSAIYAYIKDQNVLKKPITETFVLEVGCSSGGILEVFREQGCIVKGVDIGEEYLSWGIEHYDLDLSVGTIKSIHLSRTPDLIIYSHSFEHMLNPQAELASIKDVADKNTLIYIEVPGVKDLWGGYGKMDFLLYCVNSHTYHFLLTTLSNLFLKSGFSLILC